MSFLQDVLFILRSALVAFAQGEAIRLAITIGIGVILAIIGWIISVRYHKLWNKGFKIKGWHHGLCAFVAILTFVFTLTFASMVHMRAITTAVIDQWNQTILASQEWADEVFAKTYQKIKEAGIEDFKGYPPPNEGGTLIPTTTDEAKKLSAKIYAEEVAKHFNTQHPFLSKIIWSSPDEAMQNITELTLKFFEDNPNQTYNVRKSIETATENIKSNLEEQISRTVWLSRGIIILVFLLLQLIPFGIISYQAYSELKIRH